MKGRLTPFVLLSISSAIYFSPLVLGTSTAIMGNTRVPVVLQSGTYIFAGVVLAILVVIVILERPRDIVFPSHASFIEKGALTLVILLLGVYTLSSDGLFVYDKTLSLLAVDRLHLVFFNACIVGFVGSFLLGVRENFWLLVASTVGLLLGLYIGHRSYLAVALIAVGYIQLRNRNAFAWKPLAFALAAFVILVTYKAVYIAVKMGDFARVVSTLQPSNAMAIFKAGFEPSETIRILDFVLARDYHAPCSNIAKLPLTLVPLMDEVADYTSCKFNSQFQPYLFPYATDYGMGSNIWAEFYSSLWFLGVPILIVMLYVIFRGLEWWIRRTGSAFTAAACIGSIVQFSFYIQRNEITQAVTFSKRMVYVALFLWLVRWAWSVLPKISATVVRSGRSAVRSPA